MFNKKPFASEIDNLKINNRFLRLITAGFMLISIILTFGLWRAIGNERTILVPPELHKTVWVDSQTVSNEYLEEMAYYMGSLLLTVTPETVKFQNETVLKYASPESRGALKLALDSSAVKIAGNSASTIFHPSSIQVGAGNNAMKVSISGVLVTFITDKKVGETSKSFMLAFEYRSGKIYLKTLKEVAQNDPFGEKSAVTDNSIFIQH